MKILCYPDPVLARRAAEVDEIDGGLVEAAREMSQAMYEARGIGLAGPQVGLSRRLVVVNATGQPADEVAVVNPVIVERHGLLETDEGCLSLPGLFSKIARSAQVLVEAYDLQGREVRFEAEGLAARIWQHEVDHLDGVLIVDRMSLVQRIASGRLLKDLERQFDRAAK